MIPLDRLEKRQCPVCGAGAAQSAPFLDASVDPRRIDAYSFASRKTPEFMSFEFVACRCCDTVYAPVALPTDVLTRAYRDARFDSGTEAGLAAETYFEALAPHLPALPARSRALEIGTGNGAFLAHLVDVGFRDVIGIEPSRSVIEAADPKVRPLIREGVFSGRGFEPESFDFICCFQTLEHVPEPRDLIEACSRLLKPGGLLALVTHDYRAPLNRLLGRRSPIIDIEHMQLFCRRSLTRLLTAAGLDVVDIHGLRNRYPVQYWLRLAPLPAPAKRMMASTLAALGLDKRCISFDVGNLFTLGQRAV